MLKRFKDARTDNKPVSTRTLQVWALQTAQKYKLHGYSFNASKTWVHYFKVKNRIRQRKITRYIKPSEKKPLKTIEEIADDFQTQYRKEIGNYNLDYVLNTDQIGCKYRSNLLRTLDYRGAKSVEVYIGDLNKVTHSYTVMYTITASGKVLPKVFMCLQEAKGSFGPHVNKKIKKFGISIR